jgi:maltose-binding protein MalE
VRWGIHTQSEAGIEADIVTKSQVRVDTGTEADVVANSHARIGVHIFVFLVDVAF